jgi:hypothetical protein
MNATTKRPDSRGAIWFLTAILAALVTYPCNSPAASSKSVICPSSMDSVTVEHLIVEEDSYCLLTNVEVLGDIVIKTGGILVGSAIFVHGNVRANSADTVFISTANPEIPSIIEGNVNLTNLESAQIVLTIIGGNLLLTKNVIGLANSSDIFGNLVFVDNETAQINQNWVKQNLICKHNDYFTSVSGKNVVEGNINGQCLEYSSNEHAID